MLIFLILAILIAAYAFFLASRDYIATRHALMAQQAAVRSRHLFDKAALSIAQNKGGNHGERIPIA